MNIYRKPLKLLCAVLALLLAAMPAAVAEGSFEAVVSVERMNVYAEKSPHKKLGSLPRGTVVTVNAWSGIAALISYNGNTGIAKVSDMTRADAAATPAPTDGATTAGTPMVANRDTRVYQKPKTSSAYTSVAAGTSLELLAVNGKVARVSLNGKIGYTLYSHLSEPGATAAPTPEPTASADESVQTGNLAVVTIQAAQVYINADFTGEFVTLPKDTRLTLLALKGDCAMVERNGTIGYTLKSNLKKDTSGASDSGTSDAKTKSNPFAAGSNEHTIYAFLTGDMGLNRAAAMGVMANIYYESGYRPVINGDGGTSFGICQWHAGRKTNLISWCNDNGLDYTTLEGQLKFLQYELPSRYPSVNSYIRQVENTADGAYDAAYYFCFNFEAPANRTSQSTKRGNYAKNTLFPMK